MRAALAIMAIGVALPLAGAPARGDDAATIEITVRVSAEKEPAPKATPVQGVVEEAIVIRKVQLTGMDPNDAIRLLTGGPVTAPRPGVRVRGKPAKSCVPEGITGMLGYPLDNSLLVRGTPAAVAALESGLRVVDVKMETRDGRSRTTVTLVRVGVDGLRSALRQLQGSGTLRIQDRQVGLTGTPEWVWEALQVIARLEMALSEKKAEEERA